MLGDLWEVKLRADLTALSSAGISQTITHLPLVFYFLTLMQGISISLPFLPWPNIYLLSLPPLPSIWTHAGYLQSRSGLMWYLYSLLVSNPSHVLFIHMTRNNQNSLIMMQRICFTNCENASNFNESFNSQGNLLRSGSGQGWSLIIHLMLMKPVTRIRST